MGKSYAECFYVLYVDQHFFIDYFPHSQYKMFLI